MGLENAALDITDNFPIRRVGDVHSGKVRSVYWLNQKDSDRLASQRSYSFSSDFQLGVMVISDRISAFECGWKGEDGLNGVPGKGAALNATSEYFFDKFRQAGIAKNHLLGKPHPLVWIVQRAEPVMVEGIVRGFITGSMWSKYAKGQREFCGNKVPDGLTQHQQLPEALFTPTTKGIMKGVQGVPEKDDVDIHSGHILANWQKFGLKNPDDLAKIYDLAIKSYNCGRGLSARGGRIVADTKFEFGYFPSSNGGELGIIDEVLTPDSSRFWPIEQYKVGRVVEESKEGFREFLKKIHGNDIMENKDRMAERIELARNYRVPVDQFYEVSKTYLNLTSALTGNTIRLPQNPRQEILDALSPFGILN
ncbi:MAG: phosphoribosylaminoimidazolesuccinocarboxamide synthase [Nanoarchaeota archaeon]